MMVVLSNTCDTSEKEDAEAEDEGGDDDAIKTMDVSVIHWYAM
jgi:hypothetical protein